MKTWELRAREGFDSLAPSERASAALAPNEVRVKVRAVSLNFRDLVIAKNSASRTKPVIPASDGAGEVLEVGSAVKKWRVGDRVAASFFPTWLAGEFEGTFHDHALGGSIDGMLAEEVVLPESAWVKIPSGWTFEQASTLPCAGLTAFHALFVAGNTKPGDRVLVQGTGGVSIFALQLARAAGAEVIATSSSDARRARLEEMGASKTFDYKTMPAWGEAVREASGKGVDLVVEVGGAGTFDQSVKSLRFGGTLSLIGVLTGTKAPIDTHAILHKLLHVRGVYVGSVAMFEDFVRALEANRIEPIVDRVFDFADTRAAYEYMASGAHFGKVVIRL